MLQIMNVAAVSFHTIYNEKELNRKRILEYIKAAKERGADLVLFPEMVLTGYEYILQDPCMQKKNAESIDGVTVSQVEKLTREVGIYAVFGMPESDGENIYQSMMVCGPDGFVGSYRKVFLEGKEMFWAVNGQAFFAFDTPWGKVALGIHPRAEEEELFMNFIEKDIRLCLYPACMKNKNEEKSRCKAVMKRLVTEAGVFVIFANTAGKERIDVHKGGSANVLGDLTAPVYGGGSVIAGPSMHGDYHVFGGSFENCEADMVFASIDLSHAKIKYDPEKISEMRCSYV